MKTRHNIGFVLIDQVVKKYNFTFLKKDSKKELYKGLINKYSPALARDATIYFYGTLDGIFPQLPIVDMFQANATFHPYSLFNYVEESKLKEKGTSFVYSALKEGKISPNVDRVFPMEEYRDAWEYLRKPRERHGKVVIETGL